MMFACKQKYMFSPPLFFFFYHKRLTSQCPEMKEIILDHIHPTLPGYLKHSAHTPSPPRVLLKVPILNLYCIIIPTCQFMAWFGYIQLK